MYLSICMLSCISIYSSVFVVCVHFKQCKCMLHVFIHLFLIFQPLSVGTLVTEKLSPGW